MSRPDEPVPVKLVSSIFGPEASLVDKVCRRLSEVFSPVESKSEMLFFDRTRYYEREMGWPLYRRFVSFRDLVPPERLVDIKLETNSLEKRYMEKGSRGVNIDPGYISAERLILATGKNYIHRVYLSKGIFADLTLIFQKGSFVPLKWTYPDYADKEIIAFFNDIRDRYMNQVRELRMVTDLDEAIGPAG